MAETKKKRGRPPKKTETKAVEKEKSEEKKDEPWDAYKHRCRIAPKMLKEAEKQEEEGVEYLTCTCCGVSKPKTLKYFASDKRNKRTGGFDSRCRECDKKRMQAQRDKKLARKEKERLYMIEREKTLRKGRGNFFNFCQILAGDFFTADKWHLWLLCNTLQALYERHLTKKYFYALCTMPHIPKWLAKDVIDWDRLRDNHVYTKIMINMPPRSGKSRSLTMFEQWLLGKSKENRIITVSYNTELAASMSRYVRDGIAQQKIMPTDFAFSDFFPDTKIAKGNSGFMKWALEGSFMNYLGTGMEGSLTGSGANCFVGETLVRTDKGLVRIDEIAKNIENYKVFSLNHERQENEWKPIVASKVSKSQYIVTLTFSNGQVIRCTPEHRFWVLSKRMYVPACKLTLIDTFKRYYFDAGLKWPVYGSGEKLHSIEVHAEEVDVYDIQVADNHNFLVNDILAHNCLICDDLIKNASEAYNERVLDDIWNWYTGTFMSRAEHQGKGSIEIVNFTRWSTKDLCGRILDSNMSDDWINLVLPVEHNGELYCEDILPRESFERLRESMDSNIFEANYYQKPLDVEGRLFDTLKTYDTLPDGTEGVIAYCDTADEGSDYLACIVGAIKDGEGYITDIYFTQDNMQITEPATADLLVRNKVTNAKIESNNGGKGFARNVERIVWEKYHTKQVNITWFHQTENKMARILTGATFIQNHVYFPEKWDKKWPEFYKAVMGFSKEGKNKHDDGVEALVEWGKMITGDGSINSYVEWMKKMQEGRA